MVWYDLKSLFLYNVLCVTCAETVSGDGRHLSYNPMAHARWAGSTPAREVCMSVRLRLNLLLSLAVFSAGLSPQVARAADFVVGFTSLGFEVAALAEARDGAMAEAERRGVKIDYISARDAVGQQRAVESLIAKRVNVLAIDPIDSASIAEGVRAANDAGIPVIMWIGAAKSGKVATTVLSDEKQGGLDIATWFFGKVGSGKVALLQGDKGHQAGSLREAGFREALASFPKISLAAYGEAKWNRDVGARVSDNFFTQNSDLKGIVALNDEMAFGAIAAAEARQWPTPLVVTGYNGQCDALRNILQDGKLSATLYQPFRDIGAKVVDLAIRIGKGEKLDETIVVPSIVVDSTLAKQALNDAPSVSDGLKFSIKRASENCKK
jgi:ABC-type sugar transport system substrate-binding protein